MRRRKIQLVAWLVAVTLILGLATCGAEETAPPMTPQEQAALKKDIQELARQVEPINELFHKTIELVMPSVVSISTSKEIGVRSFGGNPDELFGPWPFGPRSPRLPQNQQPPKQEQQGLGSGFVVDAKRGYVVTNYHVVADVDAKDIKLTFADGREVVADEVFRDEKTEIAVIKIKPEGLMALDWGDSDSVKTGQWVIAIGSPMGLGNTATMGIVSATSTRDRVFGGGRRGNLSIIGRSNPYAIEDYIQTDAAINPGNSGGPLVTLTGEVIGINTLIISRSGSSAGLGFSVPQRIAEPVATSLIEKGRVVRGHLGVSITEPDRITDREAQGLFGKESADEVLKSYGLSAEDEGVLITKVLPGSAADKAGLREGDLIVKLDGGDVRDVDLLRTIIAGSAPKTKIQVTVQRKGKDVTLPVTLGEQPADARMWALGPKKQSASLKEFGLKVQTLTPDVAEGLGYEPDLKGVIVTEVAPESIAARAQLQRRDVIVGVGQKEIGTVEEFQQALAAMDNKGLSLLIKRGDETVFLSLMPTTP